MKNFFIYMKLTVISCIVFLYSIQNIEAQNKVTIANAQALIEKNATTNGLTSEQLVNTRVTDAYYDQLSGATLVYLQQTINGVDVYHSIQTLAFKNNKPISIAGSFVQQAQRGVNISGNIPVLSAANAVKNAAVHLDLKAPAFFNYLSVKPGLGKETEFGKLGIADNNINAKLAWVYSANNKQMNLCWIIQMQPAGKPDYWLVKVDASNGQILGKDNLTDYDNRNIPPENKKKFLYSGTANLVSNNNIQTEDQLTNITSVTYRVIPFPAESPIHPGGTPALRTNPWELTPAGSNATTLQWNYNGTTYFDSTRGNNVLAQEDHNANNGFGDGAHSSTAEPSLLFDYNADFTKEPSDSLNQGFALTNLFYWTNIMHDISYLYGFDEVSGNFQENNLGRGGIGNDYLLADGQDGKGLNNSYFTTPPDGTHPRMEILLYSGTPQKDADLDNGVICHEYTHGISRRLTGGPSNSGCLVNKEQMGEGWSDYMALMITTDWATAQISDGIKERTIFNYATSQPITGPGERKYPYSTDMTINPETYADVEGTNGEVHAIGEIWTNVLWEMTWGIIQMDGINPNLYDVNGNGGNSVAMKLVVAGMKLQPCQPGFLDARDAILKADTLLYNGKYSCTIWNAFAKRGMGLNAKQGSSDSYTDQVVDFSIYSFPYIVNHVDKISASEGETINYLLEVKAPLCENINGYALVDTLPKNVTYISSDGVYNSSNRTVKISGINLSQGQTENFSLKVMVNPNSYLIPVNYISDSVNSTSIASAWNTTSTTATLWKASSAKSHSASYSYFAKDSSGLTNATLQTSVAHTLSGKSVLSFWHFFEVESGYDGGVLDISIDSGKTWQDLGPYIIENGYSGALIAQTPLIGGRMAFTGSSTGGFILTKVDLSAFTGKTVLIKFVFVSDESGGVDGWYIDDINLTTEAAVFNTAQLFDNSNQLAAAADTITAISNSVLPISLLNFSAEAHEKQNILHWTTTTEHNNIGFEIQRSNDGINFGNIGFVKTKSLNGFSSSKLSYDFTDFYHSYSKNYYRLKQIDKDGKFSYSNIVLLKTNITGSGLLTVYPSPANNILNVKIANPANNKITLLVTDLAGKSVMNKIIHNTDDVTWLQLNISQLIGGTYFLKIITSNGSKNTVTKFIKE